MTLYLKISQRIFEVYVASLVNFNKHLKNNINSIQTLSEKWREWSNFQLILWGKTYPDTKSKANKDITSEENYWPISMNKDANILNKI